MVLASLVSRKFDVLVPFGGGLPYDLVVHLGETSFLRVQCKTAWPRTGCLLFNCRTTDHGNGRQPYIGLADIFGVYSPLDGAVYLIPVGEVVGFQGRLRLEPTRNNQKRGIRFAADYGIDRWTAESLRALLSGEQSQVEALSFA